MDPPFFLSAQYSLPRSSKYDKFFVADSINSQPSLFIVKSRFNDILYHFFNPKTFEKVFQTEINERISSASFFSQNNIDNNFISEQSANRWYLITLIRFGDGIEPCKTYRTIFVALNRNKSNPIIYPISRRSFSPQYLAWTSNDDDNELKYSEFNTSLQTYEVFFDSSNYKFSLAQKKDVPGFCFRSGVVSKINHTFFIQIETKKNAVKGDRSPRRGKQEENEVRTVILADQIKPDNIINYYLLPPTLLFDYNSDFHVFLTNNRNGINNQYAKIRCVIQTYENTVNIVFPCSKYYASIPIYNEPDGGLSIKQRNDGKNDKENNSQSLSYEKSKIPFCLYSNEVLIIGAPINYITMALIDQNDNIRAAFQTELDKNDDSNELAGKISYNNQIQNLSLINDALYLALSQETGHISQFEINPIFFLHKDPAYIAPVIHYLLSKNITDKSPKEKTNQKIFSLITKEVIQTFWNCEIFNEILLIINQKKSDHSKIFNQGICTTFIKPRFYKNGINLFKSYRKKIDNNNPDFDEYPKLYDDEKQNTSEIYESEKIYNFKDLGQKLVKSYNYTLNDIQVLYSNLLKDLQEYPLFMYSNYQPDIRFCCYLQIAAIKISLNNNLNFLTINHRIFKEYESSKVIMEIWAALVMAPNEIIWPKLDYSAKNEPEVKTNLDEIQRQWWSLKSSSLSFTFKESTFQASVSNFFDYVEKVTTQHPKGREVFILHQKMLGWELAQPICDI